MPKHALESAQDTPSKRRCSAGRAPSLPARPHDSPSNPFGRQRVRNLVNSLPPSTLFSKHLPLRFQLVHTDRPSPRLCGGVHRIAQVPANYTFMHLRCLIMFLFGGSRSALLLGEPHLFEVKRKIQLFSMAFKPGQVKSGQTWAKLSSAQDPCRYRPKANLENAEEFLKYQDEEEPGEWKWHAEEDFTLDRAWPKGCQLTRAIIFHHDHTTQVHITINTLTVPKRKGASNTPYIFSGMGLVTLSPALIPKLVFESPARPQTSGHDLTDEDQDGECESDADECDAFWADDSDASQQAHDADNVRTGINPDDYNDADAFPHFFSRCHRLSRSRLQFGSSFGQEYNLSSASEDEQSGEESIVPSTFMASSSPSKCADNYSSPATSFFGSSVPRTTHLSKGRDTASSPPQTSSPGPSSPVSSPTSNIASSSRQTHLHVTSSPGNIFETRTNLSLPKRRRSSFLHHLPFHPSPSGFPKYTPLPARGKLYRMRIKRIEKRVERMKSLEWLKVPEEEEENEKKKKKKKEEEKKAKERNKEEKEMLKRRLLERMAPGGVFEMGIRRGKRPLSLGCAKAQGEQGVVRVGPFSDEFEV
ncbi:hypothetical protein APHAL10511_006957 [Amanita phalloides]|nr:hypothetical protein APHAL10511_006957 [Amanita phalloides]